MEKQLPNLSEILTDPNPESRAECAAIRKSPLDFKSEIERERNAVP
jgi:hypothetical protein